MKTILLSTVSFALAMLTAEFAGAQSGGYPAKPIRWIVPFPPGGSVDTLARTVGAGLAKSLGQQVVIDNRSGASGNIGMEVVARAAPDGYTLGSNTVPFVANTFLYSRVPYNVLVDFVAVSLMATTANVLAVHPSVPARSVRELLQLAKSRPGALNYGTAGVGSNPHVAGELFNHLGKVNLVPVHFKGGAPAVVAAMAGEVGIAFSSVLETSGHFSTGRLRPLGVTGSKRSPRLPDVPTIAEAGLPGYEFDAWHVLIAPKGTPATIVALLSENVKKTLLAPGEPKRFADRGLDVIASSPEACATHLKNEVVKLGRVVKERGMRAD